jgi:hypothetical protein
MIAAFARDAGPAQYLSSLSSTSPCLKLFRSTSTFDEYLASSNANNSIGLILTGTCLGEGIDKKMLRYAREHDIKTVSVVDHWSWYRKRFEIDNGLLLPDMIIVNDDIACKDAVSEGLPPDRLVALGHPVLEELSLWPHNSSVDALELRDRHCIKPEKRVILFISEQLRSDFPPDSEYYLGYDEYEVIEMLLANIAPDDHLLVKLHPVEADDKYSYISDSRVSVIRDAEVQELVALGDVIIGMASMLLLQLAMFRRDIISFRPSPTRTFIGERLGATVSVNSIEDLKKIFRRRQTVNSDFRKSFIGSKERILSFLERMTK